MRTIINKLFMAPVMLLLLTIWGCGDSSTVTGDAPQTSVAAAADSNAKTVYAQTLVFGTNAIYTVPKSGTLTVNQSFPGFYNGALGNLTIKNSTGADLVAPPPPVCTGKPGKIKDCLEKYTHKVLKPYLKKLAQNPVSIQVLINGQEVVAPGQIPQTQGVANIAVAINTTNTLQVNLTGLKGAYIQLAITSENTPPLQNPLADFTYNPTSGTIPVDVSFDASASSSPNGSIVSYSWDFGDGFSDAGMSVIHTFFSPGTFQVVLTVVDSAGLSATKTSTVVVNQPLPVVPSFTYTLDSSTGALIIAVDGSGSSSPNAPIAYYYWIWGDGSNSGYLTTPLSSHTYVAPGTYDVTLVAYDALGNSAGITQTIIVP